MTVTIARICRYPVKGLSADTLDSTSLEPGKPIPEDRRFALAQAGTRFDPMNPVWLPKTKFLVLMRDEKLAKLETRYDAKTGALEVLRDGKRVARGIITTPIGRAVIEDFFAAFMRGEILGKPKLVSAPGHMFSDVRDQVLSIVNMASVHDLERIVGADVHPLRFRANLYLEGLAPWEEFDWLDKEIAIGDTRLIVTKRIQRCAATDVNPKTAERDLNIPKALMRGYGHADLGIYARVVTGGPIATGDEVRLAG